MLRAIRTRIREAAQQDRELLVELRKDARLLRQNCTPIYPRMATTVSLVATDGGNRPVSFDPLLVEVVRVMDSKGTELCFDVLTPKTDISVLSDTIWSQGDRNALGLLMRDLNVRTLWGLSPMIPSPAKQREAPDDINPSWVYVYRDLCEWAGLYRLLTRKSFASDTLVVRDGLLKSKIFSGAKFIDMCELMQEAIDAHLEREQARIWLVGLAKHSRLIERYRIAMALERVFPSTEPAFVQVPEDIGERTFKWTEYIRRPDVQLPGQERPKFNYGTTFMVRFGGASQDPIWAVDVFYPQRHQAQEIMGYLLQDALDGFPVPLYPRCLQKAHEHAQLAGLDAAILQEEIRQALGACLTKEERTIVDGLSLASDPARLRYE